MLLVSFNDAKLQLHDIDKEHDEDIYRKLEAASAIVVTHIKGIPDSWVRDYSSSPIRYDVPGDVKAATLMIFSELYYARESSISNVLSDEVINLLSPYRQPTFA
jgi:hypothetical protein